MAFVLLHITSHQQMLCNAVFIGTLQNPHKVAQFAVYMDSNNGEVMQQKNYNGK